MVGMVGTIPPEGDSPVEREIGEAQSADDLRAWHEVYSEVLGADPRSRSEWERLHDALSSARDLSAQALVEHVVADARAFAGEPDDDYAVVVIRRT